MRWLATDHVHVKCDTKASLCHVIGIDLLERHCAHTVKQAGNIVISDYVIVLYIHDNHTRQHQQT